MSAPDDMAERHARLLARYAEIAAAAAEKLAVAIDAAEEPAELTSLVGALHKAGRSLRQTIALEAKLVHDRARAVREAALGPKIRPGALAVARRRAELRDAMARIVRFRMEDAETAEMILDDLDQEIAGDEPGFLDETLDDHLARLAAAFDLPPEAVLDWRDLPPAPPRPWPPPEPDD